MKDGNTGEGAPKRKAGYAKNRAMKQLRASITLKPMHRINRAWRLPRSWGPAQTVLASLAIMATLSLQTDSAFAETSSNSTAPPVQTVNGTSWVQIWNATQLEYVDQHQAKYLTSNIELMQSIDLAGYKGWLPIGGNTYDPPNGKYSYTPYSGTFNGRGHQITGLTIDDGADLFVGLFGNSTGTIEDVAVNAHVTTDGSKHNFYTGILAGHVKTVLNSYTFGSIDGAGDVAWAGGLAGAAGVVTNCYSAASVKNFYVVGGLIGSQTTGGMITDSYATGALSGQPIQGGLVGSENNYPFKPPGTIVNSFFDTQTTNVKNGYGSLNSGDNYDPKSGVTTQQMQDESTYSQAGWDFNHVWGISPNINTGFPYLLALQSTYPTTARPIPFSIIPIAPPTGQYEMPYSIQLNAVSGWAPFTWTIVQGSLPRGLFLSSNGVVFGTPNGPNGTSTFTVQVKDANGQTATQTFSIQIQGAPTLSVTTTTLPGGKVGTDYSVPLQGTGVPPMIWNLASGTLPPGLTLAPNGTLSGTPTESGTYTFTVQLTDASQTVVYRSITMDIEPMSQDERLITWNGEIHAVPAVVRNNTTYMPIWYVMHYLRPMGIESSWDGQHWYMTSPAVANISGIHAGTGSTDIYLNGKLVQRVNTLVAKDPSTGQYTTYMPIWYVMQLLKRVGLQSTWNGTTWNVFR